MRFRRSSPRRSGAGPSRPDCTQRISRKSLAAAAWMSCRSRWSSGSSAGRPTRCSGLWPGRTTSCEPVLAIWAFLVDDATPGFTVSRGASSVSHRGYHHCELSFADCRIPGSALLGTEGRGFDLLSEWLGASRLTVAATSVGRARRVLDLSTGWAASREQFGQPIGRFQGVGFSLADMATQLEAADLLTLRAAWLLTQGKMSDADAAMAKLYASEMLGRLTDQAVQIFGGSGLMSDLPIERVWRGAPVGRVWDGSNEIQRHIISRSMLRERGA